MTRPAQRLEPWVRVAVTLIPPVSNTFSRHDWRGYEHVPSTAGVILAANHVSPLDPLVLAHFVWTAGRVPRYLAKSELFDHWFTGRVLRGARQVPVHRRTRDAAAALADAEQALAAGEALVLYPEGTITRDPDGWPMLARTGVARLALRTGAPVIPVAQWGVQDIYRKGERRVHLLPRRTTRFLAGAPVGLGDLRERADGGAAVTAPLLREATERVMARLRAQVAELRGEPEPTCAYDPDRREHVPL